MTEKIWYIAWPDRIEPFVFGEETPYDKERGIFARGPFPTPEMAEEWRSVDMLRRYWEHNLDIYAARCAGSCGRYAKVLAFDDNAGWAWRVTECSQCGVRDSRLKEKP